MSSTLAERIPEHCRPGLEAMQAMQPLAKYQGDAQPILDRLLAGETVKQIADSHGISAVAVYTWLYRNAPEDWQSIMAGNQSARLDTADTILDTEYTGDARRDGINISRAREIARNAQWHLERANRKLFGDSKDSPTLQVTVNMVDYSSIQPQGVTVTQVSDSDSDSG